MTKQEYEDACRKAKLSEKEKKYFDKRYKGKIAELRIKHFLRMVALERGESIEDVVEK